MALGIRQSFKILAPGGSLRRRVAYSLVIVRVILAPVILLAVYYLFEMGRIVDRIVNVDAPATTMSEQVSVEMLEADGPNETTSYFATLPTLMQTALQSRRRDRRSLRFKIWRHLSSSTLKKLWM